MPVQGRLAGLGIEPEDDERRVVERFRCCSSSSRILSSRSAASRSPATTRSGLIRPGERRRRLLERDRRRGRLAPASRSRRRAPRLIGQPKPPAPAIQALRRGGGLGARRRVPAPGSATYEHRAGPISASASRAGNPQRSGSPSANTRRKERRPRRRLARAGRGAAASVMPQATIARALPAPQEHHREEAGTRRTGRKRPGDSSNGLGKG